MNFQEILSFIKQYLQFPTITLPDIIEIFIFIFIFYKLISGLKGSRTVKVFQGIIIVCVLYLISSIFSFKVILSLFKNAIAFLIIGLIVIFQNEIKKALEQLGNKKHLKKLFKFKYKGDEPVRYTNKTIQELSKTCEALSETKTGALICIEMDTPLNEYINTGINVDAEITHQLLINIFEHNTPLHDGAVIIKNDRVTSATCYLPLSDNQNINKDLGTRHRAAIGMSESTDSVILVVSEETGAISVAEKSHLYHDITPSAVIDFLKERQQFTEKVDKNLSNFKFSKFLVNILLSSLVGLFSWLCLINFYDPVTTKDITNVPVTVINEEVLKTLDQSYELVSGKTTSVRIKGKKSYIDTITSKNISATADLKELSITNSMNISADIASKYASFISLEIIGDKTASVKLDTIAEIELPIEIKTIGVPRKGYYVSELIPNHSTVTITGNRSKIDTIGSVIANVNVKDAIIGFETTSEIIVQDKNGQNITDKLSLNYDNVFVYSVMYTEKTVPLKINMLENGNNKGKMLSFTYEPLEISVAGEEDSLEHIKEISIDYELVVSDDNSTTNIIKTIDLMDYQPEDIIFIFKDNQSTLNLDIQYEPYVEKTITIPISEINIKNKNDNMNYEISESLVKIVAMGPAETMDELTVSSLEPYINVYGLSDSTNMLNLKFDNKSVIIKSTATVQVNVSSKLENLSNN